MRCAQCAAPIGPSIGKCGGHDISETFTRSSFFHFLFSFFFFFRYDWWGPEPAGTIPSAVLDLLRLTGPRARLINLLKNSSGTDLLKSSQNRNTFVKTAPSRYRISCYKKKKKRSVTSNIYIARSILL